MHDRAEEYARCARALREDRNRPGSEGIFDQALTNGLAAIVARRWPGDEMRRRRVKSANECLDVIAERGAATGEDSVYELEDIDSPPPGYVFGDEPAPTVVRVALLREAIRITQWPRHGRLVPREPLREDHVYALSELNIDASLSQSFEDFDLDEYEQQVALRDSVERARARAYLDLLARGGRVGSPRGRRLRG